MTRIPGMRRARGFTLLEVLIALAIVAMSVGALLGTITSSASNVSYLKDKTLAEWVALNRLAEVRIATTMPDPGKRTGNAVMGGMRWQWEEEVTKLPIEGMLRVDVRARPTGDVVDDVREAPKQTAQKLSDSSPSGGDLEKATWTTTVTGVVSTSRSPRTDAIAYPLAGMIQGRGLNIQGGGSGTPGNGTPAPPGTGNPANPGTPGNPGRRPGVTDR